MEPPMSSPGTLITSSAGATPARFGVSNVQSPLSPSTPRPVLKARTASEILAAFSPIPQPTKSPQTSSLSPHQTYKINMTDSRGLRKKERVSYTISDDSDTADSPSAVSSTFSSPEKPRKIRKIIDLEDDNDVEIIEPPKTPPPRLSSAGHSLRQHKDLHISLRAQENADKPVTKMRRVSVPKTKRTLNTIIVRPSGVIHAPTARNEIRTAIATKTTVNRARFFVEKKDAFLPLLPKSNYINKLLDQAQANPSLAKSIVPYETIEIQPKGVKAVMKPYQLSGLSFLVYLQRNGISGILGDEMGLGKTLQTLSLIQYLKESRRSTKSTEEARPSLVVCPLSVLSSWMAESRRWTPGLKILRFHGPVKERNRLKKIATGEEDMYGNSTRRAARRKNNRLTAAGKEIVDLASDEEAEDEASVDLIVTTYEGFLAEQAWLKRAFVWEYVILDEGHKIKNDLSLISKALQGLGAEYRLILTGTPLQNNLVELWALLHWLYPEVFTERTADLFKTSFDLTKGNVSMAVMDNARSLLELIMLRRMKNSPGVDLNLPPKTDILLFVPLTPMQRFWYTRLMTRADQGLLEELFQGAKEKELAAIQAESGGLKAWEDEDLQALEKIDEKGAGARADWEESKEILRQALEQEKADDTKKSAWRKLMNLLMQLRKCCNHPYLLPHAEPDPYYLGEHVITASGKFIVLDKLIDELVIKQKKKVLIFSGFTRMLDCVEDFLSLRGGDGDKFKYMRLDGGTARARRNLGIRMFNQRESEYRVMLISTRAGGLGINLATASDVIFLDQDWNPQIMLQAEARAHRIGQTNPVTVYKLCTQGTVEEQMMGRIQKKLYLSAKVTESMRDIHTQGSSKQKKKGRVSATADDEMPQLDTTQLMTLVRRGAQALSHPEIDINEMINWDWSTMLENCKDKPADIHVSEATQENVVVQAEDEKKWLSQMEQVESRVFQGKKYTKEREIGGYGDIRKEWTRVERREGKNTTVMVDGFAINKESMQCKDWEAVPTMAGKDPRLAEPKREKKPAVVNQEQCQVCWDGGDLILCSGCPRSYHYAHLDPDFKRISKSPLQFHCPQHQCVDCEQKSNEAGGMLYRCRWCERAYCEDCLDWGKADLLGDNLQEYELLGFPSVAQAFYIRCPSCTDHHEEDHEARDFCVDMAGQFAEQHRQMVERHFDVEDLEDEIEVDADEKKVGIAVHIPSRAESLTDATTLDDSGLSTPQITIDDSGSSKKRKRKSAPATFKGATPTKRSPRLSIEAEYYGENSRIGIHADG